MEANIQDTKGNLWELNSELRLNKEGLHTCLVGEGAGGEGTLSPFLCTHVLEVLGFTTN